jgi:hypothetical protein
MLGEERLVGDSGSDEPRPASRSVVMHYGQGELIPPPGDTFIQLYFPL